MSIEAKANEVIFHPFFASGEVESLSPFLTDPSKKWAQNLSLKSALIAAFCLLIAFIFHFIPSAMALSYLFLTLVFFIVGVPSLIVATEKLSQFQITIDVLMVIAGFFAIFIDAALEGALLLVLFGLSGAIEKEVMGKARSTLNKLHQLVPTSARVKSALGYFMDKSIRDVQVGSLIFVRASEVIPLDGEIIEGSSSISLAHLTGESLPIRKSVGDEVPAGSQNIEGALTLKVLRTNNHSTVTQIINLITEAHNTRPHLQRWFDKFGQLYASSVIVLTLILALLLPYISSLPYWGLEGSIYRALAFMIAASPCALIIAVPIAYLSAINACAKKGIILKGGVTLDRLAKVKAMAFDKTGTLTKGELKCVSWESLEEGPFSKEDILSIAAGLEEHALHPVAKAVIDTAKKASIRPCAIQECLAIPGQGLEGKALLKGQSCWVAIGHLQFIQSKMHDPSLKQKLAKKNEEAQERGEMASALWVEGSVFIFYFADQLRKEGVALVRDLQEKLHLKTLILSGDHLRNVKKVALELKIEEYYGDLLPEDKLKKVTALSTSMGLAMVGDGINDAPALARATVGISMGQLGHTSAHEASDVVLMHDRIQDLGWLFRKAKATMHIVKENVTLASSIILLISIPALLGWIPLWLAVVCHEGGTLIVGLNSLRLLKR